MNNFVLDLPVSKLLQQLKPALPSRLLVKSETGTGKTLGLPVYFLDQVKGRIYVVEPRRIAAIQPSELLKRLGYPSGHQVRFESDPGTKILYLTDGIFIRKLNSVSPDDLVILDEFHERRILYDAIFSLLSDHPNLIVTSATIDTSKFESDFDVIELPAPRLHPVITRQLRISESSYLSKVIDEIVSAARKHNRILVFLPGMREIKEVEVELVKRAQQGDFEPKPIVILHSSIDPRSYLPYITEPKPAIMLATNIAETSITPVDLDVVVSSGMMRLSRIRDGFEVLETEPVPESSFQQQGGRVGRTKPGVHVQLRFEEHPQYLEPEILRTSLESVYLALAYYGIDPRELKWIDDPGAEKWAEARQRLLDLELITESGTITEMGAKVHRLGLDPELGRLLLEFEDQPEVLKNAVTLIPILPELTRLFVRPKDKTYQADSSRAKWASISYGSDWVAAMKIFVDFWTIWNESGKQYAYTWAYNGFIRFSALRDALFMFERLSKIFGVKEPAEPNLSALYDIAEAGIRLGIFWKLEHYSRFVFLASKGEIGKGCYIFPGSLAFHYRRPNGVAVKVFTTSKTWAHGVHWLD